MRARDCFLSDSGLELLAHELLGQPPQALGLYGAGGPGADGVGEGVGDAALVEVGAVMVCKVRCQKVLLVAVLSPLFHLGLAMLIS